MYQNASGYRLWLNIRYKIEAGAVRVPAAFEATCALPPPTHTLPSRPPQRLELPDDWLRKMAAKRLKDLRRAPVRAYREARGWYEHPLERFVRRWKAAMEEGLEVEPAYERALSEHRAWQRRLEVARLVSFDVAREHGVPEPDPVETAEKGFVAYDEAAWRSSEGARVTAREELAALLEQASASPAAAEAFDAAEATKFASYEDLVAHLRDHPHHEPLFPPGIMEYDSRITAAMSRILEKVDEADPWDPETADSLLDLSPEQQRVFQDALWEHFNLEKDEEETGYGMDMNEFRKRAKAWTRDDTAHLADTTGFTTASPLQRTLNEMGLGNIDNMSDDEVLAVVREAVERAEGGDGESQ